MAKYETAQAVNVVGIRTLLRALSKIDKDLQQEVRDASQAIANDLAAGARNAATTPLQRFASVGLKAKRDRIPAVQTSGMLRPGVRMRDVFYGAEFGGGKQPTTRQFPMHKGQQGYFLYPYARAHGDDYADMWGDAIDKAFKTWDDRSALHGTSG